MADHVIHLDEPTFARAKSLADEQKISVEQLISEAIGRFGSSAMGQPPRKDLIGAFADCADLLDEIVKEAYEDRERVPFRQKTE